MMLRTPAMFLIASMAVSCISMRSDVRAFRIEAYYYGDVKEHGLAFTESLKIDPRIGFEERVVVGGESSIVSALRADTIRYKDANQWNIYRWITIATVKNSNGEEVYRIVLAPKKRLVINGRQMQNPEWLMYEMASLFEPQTKRTIMDAFMSAE